MNTPLRILMTLIIFIAFSASAMAMEAEHECQHGHEDTISGLIACFDHHIVAGDISDIDVAQGLLDKLYAAQNAFDRGQTNVAINNINALINLIEAQAGKTIATNHAEHMIQHAERVIDNLE